MSLAPHRRGLQQALNISNKTLSIPLLLVPCFQNRVQCRTFTSSPSCSSKLARTPVSVPPEVSINIIRPPLPKQRQIQSIRREPPMYTVEIKGPLGEMSMKMPQFVEIHRKEANGPLSLTVENPKEKHQRAMWGTVRAYIRNHITGVSEGHTAVLRLVGVGYRASIEPTATTKQPEYEGQQFVSLKVGYSHPIELGLPEGVKASTPQPTRILLEGMEKEAVMTFAADIRKWRIPEPYKGKGIFVNDETIKLKAKKIK